MVVPAVPVVGTVRRRCSSSEEELEVPSLPSLVLDRALQEERNLATETEMPGLGFTYLGQPAHLHLLTLQVQVFPGVLQLTQAYRRHTHH